MKYYIIVGEASGDLHASGLMKEIKIADPQAEFRFWGGDKMSEVGGRENLVKHYKEASFMGFYEILKNLPTIFSQLKMCKEDIIRYNPDVIILVDYPGFNFKIAKFAKKHGFKTFYYIAPKVWAWKESRVRLIKKYVNKLFIIFPFEIEYFRKFGIEPYYGGNPIMDSIDAKKEYIPSFEQFCQENNLEQKPIISLLAGSRSHEIDLNFPFMIELSRSFPDYQFVVAGVSWLDKGLYEKHMQGSQVKWVCDKTYELLANSTASVVTSGTATLEAALLNVPEFVCFKSSVATEIIVRLLIKIKYVSLVNIIMGREVVRELLQRDMNQNKAVAELKSILPDGEKHEKMLEDYAELRKMIGSNGASKRVAQEMVRLLKS